MKSSLLPLCLLAGMYASAPFPQDEKTATSRATPVLEASMKPLQASSAEAEVTAAEGRYTQAYLHRDWNAASPLIAPDYYGNAEGFEGDLAKLKEEFPKIQLLDYRVVSAPHIKLLAPGLVLYNDIATMHETYAGRDISGRYWHGDIWVHRDGRWLLLVEQEVRLPTETAAAEAELRAAMDERRKASLEGDTEKVASLMTDEYLQTDIYGYVQDKTTWLNEYFKPLAELIKAGKFRWEVFEQKDVQLRMYGDCAVVIGRLEAKGTGARPTPQHTWVADPDASFSGTLRFTHVYMKRNGKWLLAAIHNAVPHPPSPTAANK